jgi:hypothetical protein
MTTGCHRGSILHMGLGVGALSVSASCALVALIGLPAGCGAPLPGSGGGPQERVTVSKEALTTTKNVTIDVTIPNALGLYGPALVSGNLLVGDRSKVLTPTGEFASIGNAGPSLTQLGISTETGSIVSVGSVALLAKAHVHGNLSTGGTLNKNGSAIVDGSTLQHQSIATRHVVRKASFTATSTSIWVPIGQTLSTPIAPQYYTSLRLDINAQATLVAGDYYFGSFVIENGAKLAIDDSKGAVSVYVGDAFTHEGTIVRVGGGFPRWLVSYLGVGTAFVQSNFLGTIFAPNGGINVDVLGSGQHQGSFIGKQVVVGPDETIVHRGFPWLIRRASFDKSSVCSGESVRLTVDAVDPAGGATPPLVMVDGTPVADLYDQVEGVPGLRQFAVTAKAADGTRESLLASVAVASCSSSAPVLPRLLAQENLAHPNTIDASVVNAPVFEDGTQHYAWDFGDGMTLDSPLATVSHDYSSALPVASESKPFTVTVTIKRAGLADVSTKRTFVIWNTYAISKRRGVLEPPADPTSPVLAVSGTNLVGQLLFKNLESVPLTYQQQRVDQVPCDRSKAPTYGTLQAISISVPATGTLTQGVSVGQSSIAQGMCGITFHYWGQTSSGAKAQVSVPFDLPSAPGSGVRVDQGTASLLNYVVDRGLVADPHHVSEAELARLYLERKTRFSQATQSFYQSLPTPQRQLCDPDNPGPAPQPGFACQPTGDWEGDAPGGMPSDDQIANALKGDAVLVRSCSGFIGALLGALDPPQLYTHSGIMTNNHFEITQSTGDQGWLMLHPNGILGKPTDGFEEHALRYLWPGTITESVRLAFGDGLPVATPDGDQRKVKGFVRNEARCQGDRNIVYPRVLKPAPEFEVQTRPKLMAAADAAKTIHGHYRFYTYSRAQDTDAPDPNGPQPLLDTTANVQTYGPSPTVCSQFVRLSLKKAGFEVDHDKSFPLPSNVSNNPPDGLFYYSPENRKAAGDALYAALFNEVQLQTAVGGSNLDPYWWLGAGAGVLAAPFLGPETLLVSAAFIATDPATTIQWLTNAPDDVANQVTNCFAFDYCATSAKDSDRWKDPGEGIAVSPDDLMNYFDSPATGGPYGYSERMIFRGQRFRPIFAWSPSPGTIALNVVVTTVDGQPTPGADVFVEGFNNGTPQTTDANGRVLIEGVPRGNMMVHAQKVIGSPGELDEGDTCYVPADPSDPSSQDLRLADCADFTHFLDNTVYTEAHVVLGPPKADFRKIIFEGEVHVEFQDCSYDDTVDDSLFTTCHVSPISPATREVDVDVPATQLCANGAGVKFHAHCTLLPDNRTVHVTGGVTLYVDDAHTCGANSDVSSHDFDVTIPEAGGADFFDPVQIELPHTSVCFCGSNLLLPSSCNDSALVNVTGLNNRDD